MKTIKNILFLPIKLAGWISNNTSDTCLICLYIVSVIPLLTNLYGVKFYSFLGGYCAFGSCLFLRLEYKDKKKEEPSKLFNILGIGMLILGAWGLLTLGYYKGNETILNRFHIFLLTYFGGLLGFVFGCFVFLQNKSKDNYITNKTHDKTTLIHKLNWIDINKKQPDKGREVVSVNEDGIFFIGEVIYKSYGNREGKYECVNGEDGVNNVILWIYLEDLKLSLPNDIIEKIKAK
ncbi:MAG TPA: hypothetical protein VN026_08415 [Bacteroidia bacterium]|jgi:hypothetical protein|nr:hypothetical protein [Bacteroidia bacterium]